MASMSAAPKRKAPVTPSPEESAALAERIAEQVNASIRYTMWSVFRSATPLGAADRASLAGEVESLIDQLAAKDVVVRGTYDVSGLRADADLLVWWHAPTADALQEAYGLLRRTALGAYLAPVWSTMGLHRPAEFNRSHVPAFLAGEAAKPYLCIYPFVRSYEWYLLPEEERRELLVEHGAMARGYADVRANTVASFALSDYEWMLAFEADELHRIVDLMRELRAARARRHVREEIPFFTGRRREVREIVATLP
jgi:chlorite dismutase